MPNAPLLTSEGGKKGAIACDDEIVYIYEILASER